MNPHSAFPTSLPSLIKSVWRNRSLIFQMTQRDVIGRYKGSVMGLFWSFFNPLLMLTIYTFVFSTVFKLRWGAGLEHSKTDFALFLFVGLIIHGLFSELVNQAPNLIIVNTNYVKKVIFPLEILPVISLCSALFHSMISVGVLLGAFLIFNGYLHWTLVLLPFIVVPFIIMIIGFAWFLAALGVFLRDIGQIVSILTIVMMYVSPIFYPLTAVPARFRLFLEANPLTFIIVQARQILIKGIMPNWGGLVIYTLIALVVAWIGYACFQKARKGFADVL